MGTKLILGVAGRRGRGCRIPRTLPQTSPTNRHVRSHLPLEPSASTLVFLPFNEEEDVYQ